MIAYHTSLCKLESQLLIVSTRSCNAHAHHMTCAHAYPLMQQAKCRCMHACIRTYVRITFSMKRCLNMQQMGGPVHAPTGHSELPSCLSFFKEGMQ